jgi:hypothetical protein
MIDPIAETSAARVKTGKDPTLEPAVRFLLEFLHVQRVDQAVHRQQHVALIVRAVDSLTDRHKPNVLERKMGYEVTLGVPVAREAAGVVNQDRIEASGALFRCKEESLKAGTVGTFPGHRGV